MKTSFIVITYNQEKYIRETLIGITSQTIKPDEVIIADDASSDSTCTIIKRFIKTNPQLNWKFIENTNNQGITKNLRNAFDNASGDILLINSGDDISLPNRLQLSIDAFEKNPNSMIVTGNLDVIDQNNNCIGEIINDEYKCNDIFATIKNGMPLVFPVGQAINKKIFSIFGALPTDVPNEDDQISFWGIISGKIICIDKKIMKYRIHSFSASSWIRDKNSIKDYYAKFIDDMPVRQRHMELWMEAISKTDYKDNSEYIKILHNRIKLYMFLSKIDTCNFIERLKFYLKKSDYLSFKEKIYVIFGKFGICGLRFVRNIIKQ